MTEPEVLARVLRHLKTLYGEHNRTLFSGALRPALLEWSATETELGAYHAHSRTLRLSTRLLDGPWCGLVEVLKHEMAHQFVLEVLRVQESAHGPAFRQVCQERGIDARARGMPLAGASEELSESTQRRLLRIEKLMALAGSDNQHEAGAAMAAARRLMLKYNLDEASSAVRPGYSFCHLGAPTTRRRAWQRLLATILGDHFFVEVIIVPVFRPSDGATASVLEACGTVSNLTIAAYVHDFLEVTATALWLARARQVSRSQRGSRLSFLYGVMSGFRDKLETEVQESQEQGLIWLGDPALKEFFRRRHPHVRHVGGGGRLDAGAYSAGHHAGQSIVLHRAVEGRSSSGSVGLLGGKT